MFNFISTYRQYLCFSRPLYLAESNLFRHFLRRTLGLGGLGILYKFKLFMRYVQKINPPSRVLDFGCGIGLHSFWLSRYFPESNIHGIDSSESSIRTCQTLNLNSPSQKISFSLNDYESFFNDSIDFQYDLVIALDSLYYSKKCRIHLSSLVKRIKPGGFLLMSAPNMLKYYSSDFTCYGIDVSLKDQAFLFSFDSVIDLLRQEGLSICSTVFYPSTFIAFWIRFQESYPILTWLIYPLLALYVLIAPEPRSNIGTHFMILAQRPNP